MKTDDKGTALVTGASARIGRAIAIALGARGYQVGVHYRSSKDAARETVRTIVDAGGKAQEFAAELSREKDVEGLMADVVDALGPVTCLVNNASRFEADDIDTMSRQSWDDHMEPNLRAGLRLIQLMAKNPASQGGNVINIIDQRVLKPTPQFLSYTLSKSALWAATRTLAQALAPGIRVNAIAPGPTLRNERQSEADFDAQVAATLLKRGASLDEITATLNWILSTPSLTGQMIALDGGQHLAWQTPDVIGMAE